MSDPYDSDSSEDAFYSQTGDEGLDAASQAGPTHEAGDVDSLEENTATLDSPPLGQLFPEDPPHDGSHPPVFPPPLPPGVWWEYDYESDDSDDGDGDEYEEEHDAEEEGGEEEEDYEEEGAEDNVEGDAEDDSQASEWSTTESSSEDEEEEGFLPYDNFPKYREGSPVFKDDDDAAYWRGEADRDIRPEQPDRGDGASKLRDRTDEGGRRDGSDEDEGGYGSDEGEPSYGTDGESDHQLDEGEQEPDDGRRKKKKKKKEEEEANLEPPDLHPDHVFPHVGYAWGGEPTTVRGDDEFPGYNADEGRESEDDEVPRSAWSRTFLQPDEVSELTESSLRSDGLPKVSHYIVEFPVGKVGSWGDGSDGYGYIPPSRVHEYQWKENRKHMTLLPSEGMFEEMDGAAEAMEKIRQIGATSRYATTGGSYAASTTSSARWSGAWTIPLPISGCRWLGPWWKIQNSTIRSR
jgi:hypothetical protein